MKIVIFFEYTSINGGENSMLAAIGGIQSRYPDEFEITAAITSPVGPLAERLAAANVRTTSFHLHDESGERLGRDMLIAQLNALGDTLSTDILHGNSLSMARLLGAANRYVHGSTVCHIRDIMKLSQSAADDVNKNNRLIAVSQATRDFHVTENNIEPGRIEVVYNGIDATGFLDSDRQAARHRIRKELSIHPDAFVALTAGQICLRKGLDTLAQAAVKVSQSIPGVHFVLAGERFSSKQESIDFEEAVYATFATAANSSSFHALGFRTDIADLMCAADVLVHAARQEPLGRVLLEAAAAGLSIVATNVGGTPEIITHEESGLLVPVDDIASLADSIQRLALDSALRQRLAQRANETVRERFTIESATTALARTWREAILDF